MQLYVCVIIFALIWALGVAAFVLQVDQKKMLESFNIITKEANTDFPDCTNCVRYFDTLICKCKQKGEEQQVAFLYPTDITPDIELNKISLTGVELNV